MAVVLTANFVYREVGGLICLCSMAACILWALTICYDRLEQVNRRLPPERKVGYPLGFIGPERNPRFEKEYERLFPDCALRKKERVLWAFGAAFLAGLASCIAPLL